MRQKGEGVNTERGKKPVTARTFGEMVQIHTEVLLRKRCYLSPSSYPSWP